MAAYTLMHQNTPSAAVIFDDDTGAFVAFKPSEQAMLPYIGTCDARKFRTWWRTRSVPASRELMKAVMREADVLFPERYLEKNLAVSITDTYWLRPVDSVMTYADVCFERLSTYTEGKVPYHNATSYDPNASLGGQMEKYWDLTGDMPVLVKESYRYYGQQAINEAFATWIHDLQNTGIPYVRYSIERTEDGGVICKCPAFTSQRAELVPALEVIESQPIPNDTNYYNAYIHIAASLGIEREQMQDFMDYQTLTDFVISNTDEHLLNFALLRDPTTMQFLGPAPIFDSGNSMFYTDKMERAYTRTELLERQITSFYKSEEKMLANVQKIDLVKIDLLPTAEEVQNFYVDAGIPEKKASIIRRNYETKVAMLDDLQHGVRISLYHEKKKAKSENAL